MSILDIFRKRNVNVSPVANANSTETHKPEHVDSVQVAVEETMKVEESTFEHVAPKDNGKLDMVIAFDTTGSMAAYIEDVRKQVSDLIPTLFADNPDLRLGIVAFGDYCDMKNPQEFGKAYQCLMPTDNENEIIRFIRESKNTSGGDGDEFYELVLKKIVEDTPWREGSTRSILLISDANPHPLGYCYNDFVVNNQIDWRKVAAEAAKERIKIDTVRITNRSWYKELSEMTNGISVPFRSNNKTARLVEAAVNSRGSELSKAKFAFAMHQARMNSDEELNAIYESYEKESKI